MRAVVTSEFSQCGIIKVHLLLNPAAAAGHFPLTRSPHLNKVYTEAPDMRQLKNKAKCFLKSF